MSKRAYKAEIIYEDHPTFNLWHDQEIMELLDIRLEEDNPILTLHLLDIREAHEKAKTKEAKEILAQMARECNENTGEVTYYCF